MRSSTRYLLMMPVKFGLAIVFTFFTWFGLFSYLEFKSGVVSEIHAELPYFSFLLALVIAVNCLILMMAEYYDKRTSETALERYLAKLGVSPIAY